MSPEFAKMFSKNVGSAFAKQLALGDYLGECDWGVNISEGRATFGQDRSFPIQLLGTEADGDASWLWAWANKESGLPPQLIQACSDLKTLGEQQGIPEFVEPNYSLDVADGHAIAMVASGLNPDCCYYRGPYDGGALFFLICDPPAEVTAQVTHERAVTVITEIISQFELDHREMTEAFMRSQGFEIEASDAALVASRDGQPITFSFDALNRIDGIQANLSPSQPPKKKWWQFW